LLQEDYPKRDEPVTADVLATPMLRARQRETPLHLVAQPGGLRFRAIQRP